MKVAINLPIRSLRTYLYALLCSAGMVAFQQRSFFNYKPPGVLFDLFPANILLMSLCSGILFGLISCPVCGFPLSIALGATEEKVRGVVAKNIFFHTGRFVIIFIYAFLADLLVKSAEGLLQEVSFFLAGVVMVVMGAVVLKKTRLPLPARFLQKPGRGVGFSLYLFFGLSLGLACGFEATGFLVPLWMHTEDALIVRACALFLFALSAVLPVMAMSVLFYFGFRGMVLFFKERARRFFIKVAGLYLVLLGLLFVAIYIKK